MNVNSGQDKQSARLEILALLVKINFPSANQSEVIKKEYREKKIKSIKKATLESYLPYYKQECY